MAVVDIEGVSKVFRMRGGDVRAVDGVSLRVEAGEFVAIQGPSGCGKSTLLLMAGGLQAPDAGKVVVGGQDVYGMSSGARAEFRASTVGFVFQRFHLVSYLSVLENVLAPTLALSMDGAEARAKGLLERFGMGHRLGHSPGQLSTGECQRVALARAMLVNPRVVLADEPTGNLDEENGKRVLASLAELAKEGVAVMLVTHDPLAAGYATRGVRMRHGKLIDG